MFAPLNIFNHRTTYLSIRIPYHLFSLHSLDTLLFILASVVMPQQLALATHHRIRMRKTGGYDIKIRQKNLLIISNISILYNIFYNMYIWKILRNVQTLSFGYRCSPFVCHRSFSLFSLILLHLFILKDRYVLISKRYLISAHRRELEQCRKC